jgi:hypothetical protein
MCPNFTAVALGNLSSVANASDPRSHEQRTAPFDESWSRALCLAAHPDDLD